MRILCLAKIAFVLCICRTSLSAEDPRASALLQSDTMLSHYGATCTGPNTSQSQLTCIPEDCWIHCLQFALPRTVLNSRLISKTYATAYDVFMLSQTTMNLHHLVDPNENVTNRKYQTMEEIKRSIVLIPGASIDLNSTSKCSIRFLRRFHEFSKRKIVRGLDMSSKHDFLSLLLHSDNDNDKRLLVLCKFDKFGMSNFRVYVEDEVIRNSNGPDIVGLQRLLVEEYGAFSKVDGEWTMESRSKRWCRNTKQGIKVYLFSVNPCCHLGCAIWFLFIAWLLLMLNLFYGLFCP